MKLERFKSIVLFSLVLLSFVLTTRLWFNVSIEGFFVMSGSEKEQSGTSEIKYDITKLLKPYKIIVNTATKEILLRNKAGYDFYDTVLNDSVLVLNQLMASKNMEYTAQPSSILSDVRREISVELILGNTIEANTIANLLKIDSNPYDKINSIDAFIICPISRKAYICDYNQDTVFEFKLEYLDGRLGVLVDSIEKVNNSEYSISYIYLNENVAPPKSEKSAEHYTIDRNAIVPINLMKLPVLNTSNDFSMEGAITEDIKGFFDPNEDISIIFDQGGIIKYTNRNEKNVWISQDGTLEYFNNRTYSSGQATISLHEAIKISADFIDRHLGFPEDSYLSEVKREEIGSKTVYVIRYKYRHEGMPIIMESGIYGHSIEVEIVGDEVKHYKRMVKRINQTADTSILSFINAFDLISSRNEKELIPKGERISNINDMYLAYYERDKTLLPVWVVDVEIENIRHKDKMPTENKLYIIVYDAESNTGLIIDEL